MKQSWWEERWLPACHSQRTECLSLAFTAVLCHEQGPVSTHACCLERESTSDGRRTLWIFNRDKRINTEQPHRQGRKEGVGEDVGKRQAGLLQKYCRIAYSSRYKESLDSLWSGHEKNKNVLLMKTTRLVWKGFVVIIINSMKFVLGNETTGALVMKECCRPSSTSTDEQTQTLAT